jgi:DNA-binding beta-propeller fold protein YncE
MLINTGNSHRITQALARLAMTSLITVSLLSCNCGGDGNGNGPSGVGTVTGIVHLPYDLTAEFEPVAGVSVRLSGGDYDSTMTSGADGGYLFNGVPDIRMTLSAEGGVCQDDPSASFDVVKDDTVTQDLTLATDDPTECLSLPFSNAVRMAFHTFSNTIVLLYDAQDGRSPAIVTVNLLNGEGTVSEFSDLTNAYDLELLSGGLAAFSFKSSAGFGVRFFNPTLSAISGSDVIYESTTSGNHEVGKITADDLGQTLFVTHGRRQLATVIGAVYAISVSQRQLIDADDDPSNGSDQFDLDLVAGSLDWPHGIAYDSDAGEILIANRQSGNPFMTAIDWTMWGSFNRDAGLTAPNDDVRILIPGQTATGMSLDYLVFVDGVGITGDQQSPVYRYLSSGSSYAETYEEIDIEVDLRSADFVATIARDRDSWFVPTFITNPGRKAIEEWNLSPIGRKHRYGSTLIVFPTPIARAFAVNSVGGKLYVAYENYPAIEIFDLCAPGECDAPGN